MPAKSLAMTTVLQMDYDRALEETKAALKEQGFGVLSEIDFKATMKAKLDLDVQRYMMLGVCNPPLAYEAMSIDKTVGLMLPCSVTVYDNGDGSSTISVLDPMAAIGLLSNPALEPMALTAKTRLSVAVERLRHLAPA